MNSINPDEFDQGGSSEAEFGVQKEAILKQILEPAARARLGNIKMVRPELASTVENYLIGAGAQGKLSAPVTDEQLKQILMSAQQPRRDFKINRV